VILWSVFNEEPMQGTPQGREMVRRMVAEVRQHDTTRPVTAAMSGGTDGATGVFEAVDVMGFNYQQGGYDRFHKKHPTLPITSSEDTSCFMTRGEFANDKVRNVISSYDTEFPGWGATHRKAWREIATRPFIAGGFVWTGFDYRGEPQRLRWPSVSSVFGIMDTCGFPKTAYYIHQASWIEDKPVLALAPHWNWAGREGQPIKVIVMSNAEKITLALNGKTLGEKAMPQLDYLEWEVPYSPGKLEAVAFKGGQDVARTAVETTGEPVALTLAPDRAGLAGDGLDAMPITISAVDAQGRVVPQADPMVTFEVVGPGANIGHGNGDHNCHDPEKGPTRRLFHGLAQLIVQSQKNGAGPLTIKATAPGLKPAEVTITVNQVPALPAQPAAERPAAKPKKK
jgi:beta-galactosidase